MKTSYLFLRVYIHILCALSPLIFIVLATAYGGNLFLALLVIALLPLPLVPIVIMIINKTSISSVNILFGLGQRVSDREKVVADIDRSQFFKAKGEYDRALRIINNVLALDKNNSRALLLKATILLEGYGDVLEAKACLARAAKLSQEPYSKWAKEKLSTLRRPKR